MLPSKSHVDNGLQPLKTVEKTANRNIERMAQNSTTTPDNFIEQNNTEYPIDTNEAEVFDSSEAIAEIAKMLTQIEDAEGLAELTLVPEFTRGRLNRSCRLLPPKQQRLIRQWAVENQRSNTAIA